MRNMGMFLNMVLQCFLTFFTLEIIICVGQSGLNIQGLGAEVINPGILSIPELTQVPQRI